MSDNRALMAQAILGAIIDENRAEDGNIYVDPDNAREALILALAAMMEAYPDHKTPLDIKKACKGVETELRAKITAMRDLYQRTGKRIWDADVIMRS